MIRRTTKSQKWKEENHSVNIFGAQILEHFSIKALILEYKLF